MAVIITHDSDAPMYFKAKLMIIITEIVISYNSFE